MFGTLANSHHRAHCLGVVRVEFGCRNHRTGDHRQARTVGDNGAAVASLFPGDPLPLHSPAPSDRERSVQIAYPFGDYNRSTGWTMHSVHSSGQRWSTAVWCTAPVHARHVAAESAAESNAVKAMRILQKSPRVFQ